MKAIFRILGTAAAVAATGAAIVIMDKLLNEKAAPIIESIEFPEEAEKDDAEAAKTAEHTPRVRPGQRPKPPHRQKRPLPLRSPPPLRRRQRPLRPQSL